MTVDAREQFRADLLAAGVVVETSVLGVVGQGAVLVRLRRLLDALVERAAAEEGAEPMEFPPVMARHAMEAVGYLSSFPQLAGTVFAFEGDDEARARTMAETAHAHGDWSGSQAMTDLVLVPAACHPVYPAVAARGPVPVGGTTIDAGAAWVFRHEPSRDPLRLQAFHQREVVRIDDPDGVAAWRDGWRDRSLGLLLGLGLQAELVQANDPFFGRTGRLLAANQRTQGLKFEIVVPASGPEPTAVASFNAHGDHFATTWGMVSDGGAVHTACLGFGLERLALALLWQHGLDVQQWPAEVCRQLGL